MRVLVVEDNAVVAQAVAAGLRDQGIAVDVAGDGEAGLDKAGLSPYDVIVLDRDLPVMHGDDVCARLAGRRRAPSAPPVLRRGELTLDRPRRRASRNGQLVPMTRKELGVLEVLMSADGAVISAEELLERVWDEYADPFTNAVAVTVMRLRRKLGEPPLIETVTGSGYRLP
jgi:DNA-binding response OmpR family regulator